MRTGLFVGLATLDVIQRVERLPGPNEKVVASAADVAAGGPATNASITFAALGGHASLLTALGSGPVATVVADDLTRYQVDIVDAASADHPGPSISAVTVVAGTGERSVVSRNAEQAAIAMPVDLPGFVHGVDVVLVDGHLPTLAGAAVDDAVLAGIRVVLDGGSWKPGLPDLLPSVDAAVCSAAFSVPGSRDVAESAYALLAAGVLFVAFTDGPRPVRWWTEQQSGTVEVRSVTPVDTLGAGDAFHGAFAFAVAAGADEIAALRFAANVATVRVEHAGPREWLSDPRLEVLAAEVWP